MDTEELELGGDEAKVFLSYSRKDRERAQRIADVLRERHFGVFKDTDDILPTEEWKDRLEQLISEADTIVFLLSPHSATSEVCAWEVEHASALNKRIAPIVIEETDAADIPPLLARLNFIFCTERDRFEDAVDSLVSALNVDIDWIREHTRLAGLAARWEKAGRPARLLLRGQDIADAEQWRDTHPKEAPEVTPLQAAFISDSRRAAARRQRGWVFGSLGVAAATVALAVFAWFQSIEADRQREVAEQNATEAERQRGVAEENAAEAERQRDTAESRRLASQRQLAASRLKAGDRAGGFSILAETDPDDPSTAVLAAGLQPPGSVLKDVPANTAFSLNGRLYLKGADGFIPLPAYPADWHASAGDHVALMSDTGALWLHGQDGSKIGDAVPSTASQPCFIDRWSEGRFTLFGVYAAGYSACSLGFSSTSVTPDGVGPPGTAGMCSEADIEVAGQPDGVKPIREFPEQCFERFQGGPPPDSIPGFPGAEPLQRLPNYSFPAAIHEPSLWRAGQSLDPKAITAHMIQRLMEWPGLMRDAAERFAIVQYQGETASDWLMPDTVRNEYLSAIASLTIWGGTGGEVHEICQGPPDGPMKCREFHTFSGYEGIRVDPERPSVLIFGKGMTNEETGVGPHNAWVAEAADGEPLPIPGIDAFGGIADAAFAPDGRIALLTQHAVMLVSSDRQSYELLNRPPNADAIEWLSDGRIVIFETTAMLHVSRGDGGFDSFEAGEDWFDAEQKRPNGDPMGTWLRESADGGHLLVGAGQSFYVFDTALMAPITGRLTIPDPQISEAGVGLSFAVSPEGYVEIALNGRIYRRVREPEGMDRQALVDPASPLK